MVVFELVTVLPEVVPVVRELVRVLPEVVPVVPALVRVLPDVTGVKLVLDVTVVGEVTVVGAEAPATTVRRTSVGWMVTVKCSL
jgi:hypothetical protein